MRASYEPIVTTNINDALASYELGAPSLVGLMGSAGICLHGLISRSRYSSLHPIVQYLN